MAQVYVLELKYNLQKRLPSRLASWSGKDRRIPSSLGRTFMPNQAEMRRVFDKINKSGGEQITRNDLERLVRWTSNERCVKVAKLFEAADSNQKGNIDFKDFMELNREITEFEIQDAFRICDVDGDGRISADDLQKVLVRMEEGCSDEKCKRMIDMVDEDGDGVVDMEEFMKMMTKSMKTSSFK